MSMIKCPECQSEVSERANVCPKCGCPITDETKAKAECERQQNEEKKKKILRGIIIVAGVFLLIVCFFVMHRCSAIKEAQTLNSDIEAVQEVYASDGDKLKELQKRYDNLSEFQKGYVTSYNHLSKAEEVQKVLVFQNKVMGLSLENTDNITDPSTIDKIDNFLSSAKSLKKEYSELSDYQKQRLDDKVIERVKNLDSWISKVEDIKQSLSKLTPTPAPFQKQQNTQQSYNTGNTASGNTYTNGYVTTNTLSLEKYNKLQNGMSYEQVADILGSKGNLVSSSDIAGITTLSYGWYSQYGVPMVCVVFQNGKAASMYQIGLN